MARVFSLSRAIRKQPEENFWGTAFHKGKVAFPSVVPPHSHRVNIFNLQALWSFDIRGVNMHDFPCSALPFHNQRAPTHNPAIDQMKGDQRYVIR